MPACSEPCLGQSQLCAQRVESVGFERVVVQGINPNSAKPSNFFDPSQTRGKRGSCLGTAAPDTKVRKDVMLLCALCPGIWSLEMSPFDTSRLLCPSCRIWGLRDVIEHVGSQKAGTSASSMPLRKYVGKPITTGPYPTGLRTV